MESPSSVAELHAVRVVDVEAAGVIDRLALAASAVRGAFHPALFTPLQIVRERGRLAVATSDVPGKTVPQLVAHAAARDRGLPQDVVLRIALDLLAGLQALEAAAHTSECCECLYGGLTPDSIHIGHDGQTRVLDPGVMAAAARQGYWAVDPRMLAYSAPELHTDGARYHARVDTFAVGVVLWELLSCRLLFLAPSADETIEAVCNAPIGRVRRERFVRGEPITAAVANVVARALSRDPSRRFQSYSDLALALRDAAPAAEADQVAAFVAAMDAQPAEPGSDETERLTARLPRLRRDETTARVPVGAQQPIEVSPPAPEEIESIDLAAIEVAPIEVVLTDVASNDVAHIEVAPIEVAPPIAISLRLEPEAPMPARKPASSRRGHAAWALGVALLATVGFVAFVLRSGAASEAESTRAANAATPLQPTRAEPVPSSAPSVTKAVPEPLRTASPPKDYRPTANAPAEPSPTVNAPAERRSATKALMRAKASSARNVRPAVRADDPKQPFIPDDI